MSDNALENKESARRFLLGVMSESERARMEDRFLADDDFYQELLIAEDELIDDYVRGTLPAPRRELFERTLSASSTRSERVKFARVLFHSIHGNAAVAATEARAPLSPVTRRRSLFESLAMRRLWHGFTLAAASLVLVFAGLWLLKDRWRTRPDPQQIQATRPTPDARQQAQATRPTPDAPRETTALHVNGAQPQPTREEATLSRRYRRPDRETSKQTSPVIATFTLQPGLVRGGGDAGMLLLPARANEVRLRLALEDETYQKFRATLSTPEGRRVWSRDVKRGRATNSFLTLSLPARLLESGDYVLDLGGANALGEWESVADYSFRLVRQ